jgi:hypothetical protein
MMAWRISEERYTSYPIDEQEQHIEFSYAIRRKDGSLLFRAENLKTAEEILRSLTSSHEETN